MPEQQDNDKARRAGLSKSRPFTLPSGRTVQFGQLGPKHFTQLEDIALQDHKRQYIETYTKNADLMPDDKRQSLIDQAFVKASTMTIADLGKRLLDIPVMRQGTIVRHPETGEALVNKHNVPYTAWWMSETIRGRLNSVWLSMTAIDSQKDMTFDEAEDLFRECLEELEEAAQLVGEISQSELEGPLGNSTSPESPGKTASGDPTGP